MAGAEERARWLRAAALAASGRAVQHIGCAYADRMAAQCEADMHRAVRDRLEREAHGNSGS